ncbi:NAD(P)-dependent oxidoreductase [Alcaligenaceae bacterium]|nr:NAD(P)-dependent oxidoreductase [Alcaligenaceae bacterium]
MNSPQKTIGFIGIGSMGKPMALCLHNAGHKLVLMDANPSAATDLATAISATTASSGAELARQSDIIITMLPTSAIVEQVLTGESGVLSGIKKGGIILEMSSGMPSQTKKFAELASSVDATLLDAPVSGGVSRANTGELAIMVGGPEQQLSEVQAVLACMGKSIVHTGDVGSAHAMKALNNLVSAGGFLIGIEALLIGQRFGLDPDTMVDVLNSSTGMNNSTQKKFKQFVLSRKFNSGFGLDLMVKDLTIALGIAVDSNTPAPFSSLCRELWASSASLLGKGQDHTAVAQLLEQLSQTELNSSTESPPN